MPKDDTGDRKMTAQRQREDFEQKRQSGGGVTEVHCALCNVTLNDGAQYKKNTWKARSTRRTHRVQSYRHCAMNGARSKYWLMEGKNTRGPTARWFSVIFVL